MENEYFKTDGKQIVDMLFDAKKFKDNVTRDELSCIEDYIVYLLESKLASYKRGIEFLKVMEEANSK